MAILYNSLFRGWIIISEEQRERLIKHMNDGITTLSVTDRQYYINNKFIINLQAIGKEMRPNA